MLRISVGDRGRRASGARAEDGFCGRASVDHRLRAARPSRAAVETGIFEI